MMAKLKRNNMGTIMMAIMKMMYEWKKEEPEEFTNGENRTNAENMVGLLSFLIRTNKVKGVEI
jgi:hypothetical protein